MRSAGSANHEPKGKKSNVTIFLDPAVLASLRAAAAEDNRSLSNYIAGVLQRAHPPLHQVMSIDEEIDVARRVIRSPRSVQTISNNTNEQTMGDLKRVQHRRTAKSK